MICENSTSSQELGAAFSAECSSGIQLSQQLKSNPTAMQSSSKDKPTESSQASQSSETSKISTGTSGEERLTSSPAASHVPTSALLEPAQELMESSQDYGPRCPGSFARFNPAMSSWKTRQHSLFGGLEEFSGTWPQWGMMLGGECWELTSVVTITEGNESGLLPTPIATDWKGGTTAKRPDNGKDRLDEWRHYCKAKYGMTYPHPTHSEVRMGFPEGWSAPEPLEMARFLKWQQQHGGFCNEQ